MSYIRDDELLRTIEENLDRPILLTGGCVLTRHPTLGDWAEADVLLGNGLIVGIGPGLTNAAEDDGMILIDCAGCIVMPSADGQLLQAEAADIVVCRIVDPAGIPSEPVVDRPSHTDILLKDGVPTVWGGKPVSGDEDAISARLELVEVSPDDARLGVWSDETGWFKQRLLPGGRYDETRGDREHAFQGRFWINGDRIDYLDDLGFWAFGTFVGDRLDHAGYTLRWSK
jgi:hypothetical protein